MKHLETSKGHQEGLKEFQNGLKEPSKSLKRAWKTLKGFERDYKGLLNVSTELQTRCNSMALKDIGKPSKLKRAWDCLRPHGVTWPRNSITANEDE